MLNFYATVSGGQVGDEIANDAEEFAEMLKRLAEYEPSQFEEVNGFLDSDERAEIVAFLVGLSNVIMAGA